MNVPRPQNTSVQWMSFDIRFTDFFSTNRGSTHFVMGTRVHVDNSGRGDHQAFRGIFFGASGFFRVGDNPNNPENCPDINKPRMYFELRYPVEGTDPLDKYWPEGVPPSAGFVACADGRQDKFLEDGVTYHVDIHSAEDGTAFSVYKNNVLWSVGYIADSGYQSSTTIQQVLGNPAGAAALAMQNVYTEIGFVVVAPRSDVPWNISVENVNAGWF